MSVARAVEFRNAVSSDAELRGRLMGADSPDARQKIAADAGYGDVTKADMDGAKGELSDSELSGVAGAGMVTDTANQVADAAEDFWDSFW
ncbi:MAG: Nif11 domain [Actinomycetota bacterium]|jgi:predicted ribosomally synthesized peptide with nif11-like leader|nr:Nif11 domain [Actinomycetota bacterium]